VSRFVVSFGSVSVTFECNLANTSLGDVVSGSGNLDVSFGTVSVDACMEAVRTPVLLDVATETPMMQIPANAVSRIFFITDQFLI
jgi:hypothetical protein